jgi:hypothetical protein
MTQTIFAKAKRHAERAIARGDLDAAQRWTRIMLDHIATSRTIIDLAGQNRTPKSKPKLIGLTRDQRTRLAAQTPPAPAMPVMLDPDGFSPGGTPNWYRNLQRLQNAGLPASLAPPTRRERQKAEAAQSPHPTKT